MRTILWGIGAVLFSVLSYITTGLIKVETLSAKVDNLNARTTHIEKNMGDFQSKISGDIGTIKGQNDMIIKILKQEVKR